MSEIIDFKTKDRLNNDYDLLARKIKADFEAFEIGVMTTKSFYDSKINEIARHNFFWGAVFGMILATILAIICVGVVSK